MIKAFALSLALSVSLASNMGCMKAPSYLQNFGDEVAAADIDSALRGIYDKTASPYEIKKGEFSYMERTQEIESFPSVLVLQRGDTVTDKRETPKEYIFTIVSEIAELIDGNMKPSREERDIPLRKEGVSSDALELLSQEAEQKPLTWKALRQQDLQIKSRVTYHRLSVSESFVSVPPLVQAKPNCGGLSKEQCYSPLPVTILRFDRVDWESDQGEKTSYMFVFSPDVPYFSSQLLGCAEATIPYQGQRVKIRQCEQIRDFIFGQDPTP